MNRQSDYQNWVLTKTPPEGYGKKMYYFEPGDDRGYKTDNYIWYRLNCSYWFGDWIEANGGDLWFAHGARHRAIYIVREDLMTLIRLTWL